MEISAAAAEAVVSKPSEPSTSLGPFARLPKRLFILDLLRTKYSQVVPPDVLDEMLPASDGDIVMFGSKREWETCMQKARESLRGYGSDFEKKAKSDSSSDEI